MLLVVDLIKTLDCFTLGLFHMQKCYRSKSEFKSFYSIKVLFFFLFFFFLIVLFFHF